MDLILLLGNLMGWRKNRVPRSSVLDAGGVLGVDGATQQLAHYAHKAVMALESEH